MTLLAIESATNLVGVALLTDHGSAAERSHQGGRVHAEMLVPSIEEVCAVSGLVVRDVDVVAVDVGPGLFTGLRVGVATAKALAQALGVGVLGASSLDVLAAAARALHDRTGSPAGPTVVAVVDARRGEVFAARYRFDGAAVRGVVPAGPVDVDYRGVVDPAPFREAMPVLMTPDALAASLAELDQVTGEASSPLVMVGDGAVRYQELFAGMRSVDLTLADRLSAPPPLVLGRLALGRLRAGEAVSAPANIGPDYRREADAHIRWEQRIPSTIASTIAAAPASGAPPSGTGPGMASAPAGSR